MLNFKNINKINYPYPILIIENFFDEKFLEKLLVEFPNHNEFIKYKKTMINRRFLSNDNPDFYNYINKNISWYEFYHYINSSEFYKKILSFRHISSSVSFVCDLSKYRKAKPLTPFHTKLFVRKPLS